MKKFKTVLSNLQEAGDQSFGGTVFNGFSEPAPRSALSDRGLHYAYKEAEQLKRVNGFVLSYLGSGTVYIDPKEVLKELFARLATIGYVLVINNNTPLVVGPNTLTIKVFGDKFGTTLTTDLTKEPFDTGVDYPDMNLSFILIEHPSGYQFTSVEVKSQLSTNCPTEVGSETDNTHKDAITPVVAVKVAQNESYITEESDPARVVELFLSKNTGKRILQPIYQSLKSLKKRGKYSSDVAYKRFKYAISSAIRSMGANGRIITLDDAQSARAAKRLLHNFEKQIRSIED